MEKVKIGQTTKKKDREGLVRSAFSLNLGHPFELSNIADSSHLLHPPPTPLGGGHFASADGNVIATNSNHVANSQQQPQPALDPISRILMIESSKRAFLNVSTVSTVPTYSMLLLVVRNFSS